MSRAFAGPRRRRAVPAIVAIVGVALLLILPPIAQAPSTAGTAPPPTASHPAPLHTRVSLGPRSLASPPSGDWPQFHQSANLSGAVVDGSLSSANASKLGVAWAADLYGAPLDSPVIAYDPALHEELAYIGTETGNVIALNVANGQIVWGVWVGSPIRSTPLVAGGAVFVGTFTNPMILKLNASTGATDCSLITARPIEGTPTYASPPGGVPTLYVGTEDTGTINGALLAVRNSNCTIEWSFSAYLYTAGVWTPASYGTAANGTPLAIFGTSDPDSAVYALNAVSGALVWRFQSANPSPGAYDIGAGAVIASPGANGVAAGVVYVPSKYGVLYALYLNNGTVLWSANFDKLVGVSNGTEGGRSTPALDGTNLVFGTQKGLLDLNASTGKLLWKYTDPTGTEAIASPAIAGTGNAYIAAVGDVAGGFEVVALSNGTQLYHYLTGGYITASPAISGGNIVIGSTDGHLYDFKVGGGNDAVGPTTSIAFPAQAANLTNPNGNTTVRGNATDPLGIAGVEVAIQSSGTGGPWWDGSTMTWVAGPFDNLAKTARTGTTAVAWNYSFPVPAAGGTFQVTAYAVSTGGQSDILGAQVGFAVFYTTLGPHLETSPTYIAPGWGTTVNGGGFGKGERVAITLHGVTIATLKATKSGALPATRVTIPESTNFGPTSLVATGVTSGKTTSAAIIVANSWDQLGYNVGHTGFEPSDTALNFLVYPGNNTWVRLAWHFDAGSPLNASPVVADGVAYVADTVGQVFAVDITNGGLLWTWTLPSGKAIDSSPAVNTSVGLLFVAGTDGTLSAIALASGRTTWTDALGGSLTAPVFTNGKIYIASSTGTLRSIWQGNGTTVWSHAFPNAITGAPALNLSAGLVVVGTTKGSVSAVWAANGTPVWTFSAGGSIEAAVTVSGGFVFFGSTNDRVYCLAQATGKSVWSYTTGGAVVDTGALSNKYTGGSLVLIIGSNNGDVYELNAATGTLKFSVSFGSAIEGVAAVEGIVVAERENGAICAARTYSAIITMRDPTAGTLVSSPVIVDSTIYVTGSDGYLYAYTTYGQAPD